MIVDCRPRLRRGKLRTCPAHGGIAEHVKKPCRAGTDVRIPHSVFRVRNGQALIEFIVGLVVVVVLFAGLIQLATLTRLHTEAMVQARREAGERAMSELAGNYQMASSADYIEKVEEGEDDSPYSRDDTFEKGNPFSFDEIVVSRAAEDSGGWGILDRAPAGDIARLHGSGDPVSLFGLVKGDEEASVPVISAVQSLLYNSDTIDIEVEVWMTLTEGLY
jgi:hypothetical protein